MSRSGPSPSPGPVQVPWSKIGCLVGGQAAAQGGSFVLLTAMTWTAVQLGGTLGVSLMLMASSIPRALMLLFGGAIADMLGPRYVVLRSTSVRVLLLLVGAFAVFRVEALWLLITISALEGTFLGLGGPASSSLMPHLAKGDYLARANSLYSMALRLSPIAGVPAGAWLIASAHLGFALLASAGTSLVALCCLLYVTNGLRPPAREPDESLLRRSADGLRMLALYPRLRWMFIASFALDFSFNWPLEVALPLVVDERGWNVGVVGTVAAAFGVGAMLSSGIGALFAHRIPIFLRLVVGGVGVASGILAMALLPSQVTLHVASVTVGVMFGFAGPAILTVYQQAAPKDRMGAVMSSFALSAIGTAPLSITVFSSISLLLGVSATWALCGIVAFLSPLAAAMALRHPVPAAQQEKAPGQPVAT